LIENTSAPAPTIIIVDDDTELLKLIALLLQRIQANAITMPDGASALNYLSSTVPDLIILDLMLPDIDGLDVLRTVRRMRHLDRVPVLILTARADSECVRQGLDLGADSYITKPYVANNLLDRVRLLLSTGHQPRRPTPPPTA